MDHHTKGPEGAAPVPKRKLQVARETLRQLGARAMRAAAGGTQYTDHTCVGLTCPVEACMTIEQTACSPCSMEDCDTVYPNCPKDCETSIPCCSDLTTAPAGCVPASYSA